MNMKQDALNNKGRRRKLRRLHRVDRVLPKATHMAAASGDPARQPVAWGLNATHCF